MKYAWTTIRNIILSTPPPKSITIRKYITADIWINRNTINYLINSTDVFAILFGTIWKQVLIVYFISFHLTVEKLHEYFHCRTCELRMILNIRKPVIGWIMDFCHTIIKKIKVTFLHTLLHLMFNWITSS